MPLMTLTVVDHHPVAGARAVNVGRGECARIMTRRQPSCRMAVTAMVPQELVTLSQRKQYYAGIRTHPPGDNRRLG
jgi:molybdopterin biosynthesis enzyme